MTDISSRERVARAIINAMGQTTYTEEEWANAHPRDKETAMSWADAAIASHNTEADALRAELRSAELAFKRIAQEPATPKAMREIARSRAAHAATLLRGE